MRILVALLLLVASVADAKMLLKRRGGTSTSTSSSTTSTSTTTSTSDPSATTSTSTSSTTTTLPPIACTVLNAGVSTTDATSYTSASISPVSNTLTLALVISGHPSNNPQTPTASGAVTTWTQVNTIGVGSPSLRRITIFRALEASPAGGTVNFDFGGETQLAAEWVFLSCTNTKTSGTNGADAIVQSVTQASAATSTPVITLAAFADANNATLGFMSIGQNGTMTEGSGFSELHESATYVDSWFKIEVEFKNTADTSVDWTFSGGFVNHGIALELARVSTTTTTTSTSTTSTTIPAGWGDSWGTSWGDS